jgi:hypothetical protein
LDYKILKDLRGNLDITLQEKLWQLIVFKYAPLLHANLGQISLTSLKPPTTRNNFHPIITLSFSSLKFRKNVCVLSFPLQHLLAYHFIVSHQINLVAMIFKNDPQTTKESSVLEPCETDSSKMAGSITTVTSPKSEKKIVAKSISKKKMATKTKRGESKTLLSNLMLALVRRILSLLIMKLLSRMPLPRLKTVTLVKT